MAQTVVEDGIGKPVCNRVPLSTGLIWNLIFGTPYGPATSGECIMSRQYVSTATARPKFSWLKIPLAFRGGLHMLHKQVERVHC